MGKSKAKNYGRNWYDEEDNEDYGNDYRANRERRKEKKLKNLIRSKNVDQLLNMDEDE
jgi:hypothetical protein